MSIEALEVLAKTIYGEARGENDVGKIAVAHVILNRAKDPSWWGSGIVDVCMTPWQFSCWNDGDPNREKLDALGIDNALFMSCCSVAALSIANIYEDPTGGANHYHTSAIAPSWSLNKTPCAEIGHHLFYRID